MRKSPIPLIALAVLTVGVPAVYLPGPSRVPVSVSQDEVFLGLNASQIRSLTVVDWCWKFYLRKHGREELEAQTVYFDRLPSSSAEIARGSLVIVAANNPAVQPTLESNALQRVSGITDSNGAPSLAILRK